MAKPRRHRTVPTRPALRTVAALSTEDPEGFGIWVRRHLEWMLVRNYSKDTVRTREPCLVSFAEWCAVRGVSRPRDVTKPILEAYRRYLFYYRKPDGRPLALGTQMSRLAPL
jgi:integrase/recombinase XerD